MGRTIQLIKLTALYSLYGENQLNLILSCNDVSFDVIHFLLILSSNKENVTFTWPAVVQNILFFTITGDKFVIYAPIRRYSLGKWLATPGICFFYAQGFNQSKAVIIFKLGMMIIFNFPNIIPDFFLTSSLLQL